MYRAGKTALFFFICSPQIFPEYLPTDLVQSIEEINIKNPVLVLKVSRDMNYDGKCYGVESHGGTL